MKDLLFIAGAGLVAGAMNGIAGGGSFVTLPALMAAGVPSVSANATSTVALVPSALASAYAYRKDFAGFPGVSFRMMAAISVAGGLCGALLLMVTPQRLFDAMIPWLLLFGTIIFAFGRKAGEWMRARVQIGPPTLMATQFALGVYGGYFGGAVGIMMLAAWSLMTDASLAAMQPSRNLLNSAMNMTASLLFIFGGLIWWRQMFALLIGAVIGGYLAAHFARKLDPNKARIAISCLNAVITGLMFWKTFGR
ncbi:MAG: sulfite exporter TauE/SafE family protein [Hyphomicrobiales bacterium]|nr:sulfite exporter TauE/SafE family protein [Hyphomicrobiales bacterium]